MDAPPASRGLTSYESGGNSMSLLCRLEQALELENSFPPCLRMPKLSKDTDEVTLGMRNGCAQVLRCLKVWYDLPSEVLFLATAHLDKFLSRMKVRPKHLSVIALSCFHLAARQVAQDMEDCNGYAFGTNPFNIPDPRDLLLISQCRCSLGDLSRMEAIVAEKLSFHSSQGKPSNSKSSGSASDVEKQYSTSLSVHQDASKSNMTTVSYQHSSKGQTGLSLQMSGHSPVIRQHFGNSHAPFPNPPLPLSPTTPASFLHIFHSILKSEALKINENDTRLIGESNEWLAQISPARLLHHLEAIACDGSLSSFRTSEIALAFMCVMLDQILGSITCLSSPSVAYNPSRQTNSFWMLSCAMEIQKLCKITDARFTRCHSAVLTVVGYYESQHDASRWCRSDDKCANEDEDDEISFDEDDDEDRVITGLRQFKYSRKRRKPGAYVEGWGPLAWRVSQRTLRNLRPTEKLVAWPPMPTIHESTLIGRVRSCSLSSEESSDPSEEEEDAEAQKNPVKPSEWRVAVSPCKKSTIYPVVEEEG
ncbi:hypothetical protein J437_LFUL010367 [Ladona fulva]|uniref:Cyclin N-terminal domain-containing protein n=1 Tax=Ladona fulva TaxID=123851 RepID=A0A8K0P4T8_LADFU|nr:hypothetical protein J437_LFUL010367 [Ladona fulva]